MPINESVFTGRTRHGCSLDNSQRIIVFGGRVNDGFTNDMFIYDIFKNMWVKVIPAYLNTTVPPEPRIAFSMNILENQLWVFGGYTNGNY